MHERKINHIRIDYLFAISFQPTVSQLGRFSHSFRQCFSCGKVNWLNTKAGYSVAVLVSSKSVIFDFSSFWELVQCFQIVWTLELELTLSNKNIKLMWWWLAGWKEYQLEIQFLNAICIIIKITIRSALDNQYMSWTPENKAEVVWQTIKNQHPKVAFLACSFYPS